MNLKDTSDTALSSTLKQNQSKTLTRLPSTVLLYRYSSVYTITDSFEGETVYKDTNTVGMMMILARLAKTKKFALTREKSKEELKALAVV